MKYSMSCVEQHGASGITGPSCLLTNRCVKNLTAQRAANGFMMLQP